MWAYNRDMPKAHFSILNDPLVNASLKQAWLDSNPGVTGGHEEGGFILQDSNGSLTVMRWPLGEQDTILIPSHPDCQIDGKEIVATFHTRPNIGSDYLQEPSETDKRSVRNDADLKSKNYVGEFVISQETIYLITLNGQVRELAETGTVFAEE
jgi:hypothetical protein